MGEQIDAHVLLTFGTESGTARSIRINNPQPLASLSHNVVTQVMNSIITSEVLTTRTQGRAEARRRAQFVRIKSVPVSLGG